MGDPWSKVELRRSAKRAASFYVPGLTLLGGIVAYFAADLTTAILMSVALAFASVSGFALTLKFADWYSDFMNSPWGRRE